MSRCSGDRGDTSTQLVLVTPALLACVLVVVQLALWLHATHVGDAAAARGAAAAAVVGGSVADGRAAVRAFVTDAGARLAEPPSVQRGAIAVQVGVRLRVPRLVPGMPRTVTRRVTVPVERFVPEGSR